MKIKREEFLSDLIATKAGLSPREFVEQSSCFVFENGEVMTFNDEVACIKPIKIHTDIKGAVQANTLLALLQKFDDDEFELFQNDSGELEFRGKRKRFAVLMEPEIHLPISKVERPEEWLPLDQRFAEAINLVKHSVSTDDSKFTLTCIHITDDYIEACNNLSLMRVKVELDLGRDVLVRGTAIEEVAPLGMAEIALTKSWLHFRQADKKGSGGLRYACRHYNDEYPDLLPLMKFEGHRFVIPQSLGEAATRSEVCASDNTGDPVVLVTLKDGKMSLFSEGLTAWSEELLAATYNGKEELGFYIAPDTLRHIATNYKEAELNQKKLKVSGSGWKYVTVLANEDDRRQAQAEEAEARERKRGKGKDKDEGVPSDRD